MLREGRLVDWRDALAALDLNFLSFLTFIGVIAAVVQVLEMVLDRFFPRLYNTLVSSAPHHGQLRDHGRLALYAQRDYNTDSCLYGVFSGLAGRWLL